MGSIQEGMPSFIFCNREAAGYPAGRTILHFGYHNMFEVQMAEFVRAVKLRKPPRRGTIHDAVLLLETLEKLRQGEN